VSRLAVSVFRIVFILAAVLVVASSTKAGSLYGTVTEVNDGDVFTVVCLKQPIQVRLMGIDAPERNQAYADVARQHLSDLILNKFVAVKYTGLGDHGLIVGKVFLNEVDVGAQMLRDGVAWFDKDSTSGLTDNERQVYTASEHAARTERRGIWQDENPVSPWAFRQGLLSGNKAKNNIPNAPANLVRKPAARGSLSNDDLLKSLVGSGNVSVTPSTSITGTGEWKRIAPAGEQFFASIPDAYEFSDSFPTGNGETVKVTAFLGFHQSMAFFVMSMRGPNDTYTDASAADDITKGLATGLNRNLQRRGLDVNIEPFLNREMRLKGYLGRYYDLAGALPGVIRAFTRQAGDRRIIYLIGVLNGSEGNPSVDKFLDSFVLTSKQI